MMYIKIKMGYLRDNWGITSYDRPKGSYCVTFWHVEGVTTGSHHSSAPLALPFQAFEGVQRAAISVRDHVLV